MNSSSPSLSSSQDHTVTSEKIKLFHTIDRNIYYRLVLNLGRDPFESMHVIALFLWLEHYYTCGRNLIYRIQSWPDALIIALADESVRCISCLNIDDDHFPYGHFDNHIISWIRKLTNNQASLVFFREHRVEMLQGIFQLVRDVCLRAFDDIMKQAMGLINPMVAANEAVYGGPLIRPMLPQSKMGNEFSLRAHKKWLNNEIEDLLNRIRTTCILEENTDNNIENDKQVEVDERIIFLTFSKDYSILKDEVRDFFIRKFGEIFGGVEMQEVVEGEQPLFAKLVVVTASAMDMVLKGEPKVKFSINGKHVWARKYVRKNHKSQSDHLLS